MFVHISPDAESFGETMSTLKFAERVATVELGAARSNKESGEIQILKDQVGSNLIESTHLHHNVGSTNEVEIYDSVRPHQDLDHKTSTLMSPI